MKKLKIKEIPDQPHRKRYAILNDELDHLPIQEAYPKLIEKLKVDLVHAGDSMLRKLIAGCPADKLMAGYIYAVATQDYSRVEAEAEVLLGQWTLEAKEDIAARKKDKTWHGGAYSSDTERWIAANKTQYRALKNRMAESKRILDATRRLWEVYEDRLGALQSYAKLVQKRMGLSVEQKYTGNNKEGK